MIELVALGLMKSAGRNGFTPDEHFTITAAGRKVLEERK